MANNNRIYYAVHAVGFAPYQSTVYEPASGVQSVGINTTFNLEQVFQLGQLELYENIENIPDVELTVEKVIDGAPLLQHLATPSATSVTLAGRYNSERCQVAVSYYSDTSDNATGTPLATCHSSGMYLSSLNFSFPVDGNFTESVTLVGNDKVWATGTNASYGLSGVLWTPTTYSSTGAPVASDGVHRRENIVMSGCKWPTELPGIGSNGVNALAAGGDKYSANIQSVNISTDLGRTELFELGRRGPYHRFADFPTEVTCSIEMTETEFGDFVNAQSEVDNVSDHTIYILLSDRTRIYLGTKNKLSSISSSGGDTGGGNRTVTYNYSNFNALTVTQDLDPAGLDATDFGVTITY